MWPSTSSARAGRRLAAVLAVPILLAACAADAPPAPRQPPPFPGSVAATTWRVAGDPPEAFGQAGRRFESPRVLLQELMTKAVSDDDGAPEGMHLSGDLLAVGETAATAWIQATGTGDDSMAGSEIRLAMARDGGGWFIESLSYRDHCRRGVDRVNDICA